MFTIAALLSVLNGVAQVTVPDADFEEPDTLFTRYWKPESDNFLCKIDNREFFKGSNSLKCKSKTEGHHFFSEEFSFRSAGLRKYKLKCRFKTKDLAGKLYLGARIFDSEGNTLTKMMFTLTESRDQNWASGEGFFISEKKAAKIRLFGSLFGTGEAWFDDVSIEELPKPDGSLSTEVAMYVHEYFDIVYANSIIQDKNFLAGLKSRTMYLCGDKIGMDDCRYILQQYTTRKLNDNHSFFCTPREWREMTVHGKHQNTGESLHNYPTGRLLEDGIACISLPVFVSPDPTLIKRYADTLLDLIARFDKQTTKGWIVDLSKNGGGNCFPMIAGLGPLIGNGVNGYSFSGDGSTRKLIHNDGWTGWDSTLMFQNSRPYRLNHTGKPIAVIYSENTASSGEITAIAFIGLPGVKSFGRPTAGATTTVDNFEMSDGSYLNLAAGTMADRNKNKYNGKIAPDVETRDTESAMQQATKWISEQAGQAR